MFKHVPEENTSTGTTAKIHKVLGLIVEMYHYETPFRTFSNIFFEFVKTNDFF